MLGLRRVCIGVFGVLDWVVDCLILASCEDSNVGS